MTEEELSLSSIINTRPEEGLFEVRQTLCVELSDNLEHAQNVVHVIEIDDGVVDGAEDLQRVTFEHLVAAQLRDALHVLETREHLLYVSVRLEQSIDR